MNSKVFARTRIAVIDYDNCFPSKCGWACMRACPVNRAGKECITKREDKELPAISEELCIGCKICVPVCPFNAISIVNLEAKLGFPVHQFGVNGFRLYGLPVPKNGSVLGLIGRNGVGKSTALNILAGKLKPNFGFTGKSLKSFKGTELQLYFENLEKNGLKVSFKTQNIDLLAKAFKGTVNELLEQMNETGRKQELSKVFGLTGLFEKGLSEVSGGELQRIAIVCCMLKNADLYFFDEPSTFLDVRERIRVAREIRGLALQDKMVVVVEHDLAVLDYLADYVHILFGESSVYGVVSERLSSRNGINQYLDGYLKTENIRFRSKPVKLNVLNPLNSEKKKEFFCYPELEKKLGSFFLYSEKGCINEGEIIGVLGANASGKTTFVKMLAGVLKPDNTELKKLRVSYKPQYISTNSKQTLRQAFSSSQGENLLKSVFAVRLNLPLIADRKLCSLSGGELQKAAITLALSKRADIYLLDEPTAFVDIEDRLAIAQFIRETIKKNGRSAIVVDHDLVFQDFISDRIIVFSGKPGVKTNAFKPEPLQKAMNLFLRELNITFRRDPENGRPRANKHGSQKDVQQKKRDRYYYAKK